MLGFVVTLIAGTLIFAAVQDSGATPAPRSTSAGLQSGPTLCESVPELAHLVVRRSDAFPQNHVVFSFPTVVSVNDAASVQKVASALCALPRMPKRVFHCPADFGIVYQLSFSTKRQSFPPISIEATGCQTVKGLGEVRWVAQTAEFWKVLGEAMRLSHPSRQTFAGRLPNS